MKQHTCEEYKVCMCSIVGLEPNEDCPVHGYPYPARCECGRFVSRPRDEVTERGE